MYVKPTAPASIAGVLDEAFKLFRSSFVVCLPLVALIAVLNLVPANLMQDLIPKPGTTFEDFDMGNIGIFIIISYYITSIMIAALLYQIDAHANNATAGIAASLQVGLKKSLWTFVSLILYMICMMAGFMLLVVPGVWLSVALCMCIFAVTLADKNGFASLGYSMQLVKGNWWRTFLILNIFMLISIVIMLILTLITGVSLFTDPTNAVEISQSWYVQLANMVVSVPLMIFMVCGGYALYQDLLLRREGSDLDSRIIEA